MALIGVMGFVGPLAQVRPPQWFPQTHLQHQVNFIVVLCAGAPWDIGIAGSANLRGQVYTGARSA